MRTWLEQLMHARDIIVIGGSAGALPPLLTITAQLPIGLRASIFVVLHRSPDSIDMLGSLLGKNTHLAVGSCVDGHPLESGMIYVAPPDRHLIVKENHIRITKGPRENQWRPSIDVLFRSAAVAFGPRVTAILLSGALDDGSAGLSAVRRCGGTTIVQEPSDAEVRDMPESAIRNTRIDHVVPAQHMATLIARIAAEPAPLAEPIPEELILEAQIAEGGHTSLDIQNRLGSLTPLTCTDCGGPLWQQHSEVLRFRCLTGHALSARALEKGLDENLDLALWAAVRQFEQRANLQLAMAEDSERKGRSHLTLRQRERASESKVHADALRGLLMGVQSRFRRPPPAQAESPKIEPDPS
jgi:two-component system, chemotaxis family, protein-glutamate methylesterase/glutaminase